MRLAIFSDNFYPELSGISDSIIRTAKELAKRGHFINFYAPRYPRSKYEMLKLPPGELDLGEKINIVRFWSLPFPGPTGQSRAVIPNALRWIKVKPFNPDIIHSHLLFGVGFEALIAAKVLKKPFVGTTHTPLSEFAHYLPIQANWFKTLNLKYNIWYYNHCQLVTSPCRAIFDEMTSGGLKAPHQVVSNPVDLNAFQPLQPNKNILKKKFGFSDFTILYAGRLASEKRVDLVIRAIARLCKKIPNINFVIAGTGPVEAELRNLAATLHVKSAVKFVGFIKDTKVFSEIYNASDVFAIMSPAETQSLVAMQAMACGLPVIGVKAWGIGEYLSQAGEILVEVGDDEALSDKILFLYQNPKEKVGIGKRGKIFVKRFKASAIADIWERIYEKTIKEYN